MPAIPWYPMDPTSQDIFVSAGVIFGTLLLSKVLRTAIADVIRPGLLMGLLLEGIATFELCAVSFECGLFFENHGKKGFFTAFFFIALWRSYHWKNVATVPYAHIESWLRGAIPIFTLLLLVAIELGFGATVYNYYTKPIWSLQLSPTHVRKFSSTAACKSLVRVNYLRGMMVEFMCTFFCSMLLRLTFSIRSIAGLAPILKALILTSFVFSGFDHTGGHMSPVLASVRQFGCGGITAFEHVVVYWVGACSGGVAAYWVWTFLVRVRGGGVSTTKMTTTTTVTKAQKKKAQ